MAYDTLATKESIKKTIASLGEHGFTAEVVSNKEDALSIIKNTIPRGASVMNGASKTLDEIGYIEYLKSGAHGWINNHETILKETDPVKQGLLRKYSVVSDYYLGSAHAASETGELVFGSNSGSQLPHLAFTSPNAILVVSTKKIVPTLEAGLARLREYVYPLEDQRAKDIGWGGTMLSKILILNRENPKMGRKVHVILVEEELGF